MRQVRRASVSKWRLRRDARPFLALFRYSELVGFIITLFVRFWGESFDKPVVHSILDLSVCTRYETDARESRENAYTRLDRITLTVGRDERYVPNPDQSAVKRAITVVLAGSLLHL